MTTTTRERAVSASRNTVMGVQAPAPEGRWNPLPHKRVVEITEQAIANAGFEVRQASFQLSHGKHRMFGTYYLDKLFGGAGNDGAQLLVGCRNSTDKEFAMAFAAGESVMVCSNGCFFGDLVVSRKHTTNCETEFVERISERIGRLPQVVVNAEERIGFLQSESVEMPQVHDIVCRGVKSDVFAPSEAFKIIGEYEKPSFDKQGTGTLWGVHNAATHVFKSRADRNPLDFQQRTVRLQGLLLPDAMQKRFAAQFDTAA